MRRRLYYKLIKLIQKINFRIWDALLDCQKNSIKRFDKQITLLDFALIHEDCNFWNSQLKYPKAINDWAMKQINNYIVYMKKELEKYEENHN